VKSKEGKYGINICGAEKYCNGSAVCRKANGYGSLTSVLFDYNRRDIKLKYSNGSKCNNSKLNFRVLKSSCLQYNRCYVYVKVVSCFQQVSTHPK